jgi:hypothetical protein
MVNSKYINDFTIMSVNYKDKKLLDLNYRLTKRLNSINLVWMVIDNAKDSDRLDDNRFQVINGVPFVQKDEGSRSYHDGNALNKGIQEVNTRFVLILHPDCFILQPDWINKTLSYMQENKLAFFGVPCHPRKYTSFRYFPYTACLFIDISKVNKDDLNFIPEIDEFRDLAKLKPIELFKQWIVSKDKGYIFSIFMSHVINKILSHVLPVKAWVGMSGDTCERVYRKFRKISKYDYVTPVWKVNRKFITKLIPDFMNEIPHKDYISQTGFKELGYYDVENEFNCETYIWQNKPFCFHIRSTNKDDRNELLKKVEIVLKEFEK